MALTKYLYKSIENQKYHSRVCLLQPTQPELHTIHLESGKNEIGRSKETGIRDTKCSKKQLHLDVNMENCEINVVVLGLNPSSINGFIMKQGAQTVAQHGDILEVVYGRHPFEIVFKPPPESDKKIFIKKKEQDTSNVAPEEEANTSFCALGDNSTWDVIDNGSLIIFNSGGLKSSAKIASYDMDGTIITTKSGNVFPKDCTDWKILHPDIPKKLRELASNNYKICFFTNQAGICRGKVKLGDFKQKIRAIVKELNVPIQVFISAGEGIYRKPVPGMWKFLEEKSNDGIRIDLGSSFYVGDAAGRDVGEDKKKRDHSCCDRLFALNIGLKFFTPEEHFFNKRPMKWKMPEFDPRNLLTNLPQIEPETTQVPSDECELIVLVGLPGSGKSAFAHKFLEPRGYTVLNADTLGSTQKCAQYCEPVLKSGRRTVIDNTNVDVESRKKFLNVAAKHGIPCRCFIMNVTLGQLQHNLAFRHLTDKKHAQISPIVMNTMKKKYTEPSLDEGFTEIAKVNIKYDFQSPYEQRLYKLYLVEK